MNTEITKVAAHLPDNLPEGARTFQAAVDGLLSKDVWSDILKAQVEKAKGGDRGAAKFLIEYAGGVASMRGATFVQENHQHNHYHENGTAPRLTNSPRNGSEVPARTPEDFEADRERHARQVAGRVGSRA